MTRLFQTFLNGSLIALIIKNLQLTNDIIRSGQHQSYILTIVEDKMGELENKVEALENKVNI